MVFLNNRASFMSLARVCALLIIAAPVWAADNDPAALNLLKAMQSAGRQLNYQGTFVYVSSGKMESMRIYHRVDEKGEHDRMVHLNGSTREVVRDGDKVTCILSDKKSVHVSRLDGGAQHFLSTLPSNFSEFTQYYTFALAGQDRVAGRVTKVVRVDPRDKFRYGYRFWLDAESSLLLKSQVLAENGIPIEQLMFTSIEIVREISPELLKSELTGERYTVTEDKSEGAAGSGAALNWRVVHLPLGFQPTGHTTRYVIAGGVPTHHIILSDGLASVSVYIEKLDPSKKRFVGSSFMGAVSIHGAVVDEHQVTVVGEVPAATVKMVANSIQYVKP